MLGQTRLADARLTAEEEQPAPAPDCLTQSRLELGPLGLAANIRRSARRRLGGSTGTKLGLAYGLRRRGVSQPPQLGANFRERLVAVVGRLRQQAVEQREVGLGSHVRRQGHRRLVPDRLDGVRLPRPSERVLAGEELKQRHTEREDVGAGVGLLAQELLGRHVDDGANHLAGFGQALVPPAAFGLDEPPRHPEIHHLHVPLVGQDEVRGLQVTMHDTMRVRFLERLGNLAGQLEHPRGRQRALGRRVEQRLARHVLHDDAGSAIELGELVDLADVGMIERRRRLGLPAEPLVGHRIVLQPPRDELDGDRTLERPVLGQKHLAHATRAQAPDDAVANDWLEHNSSGPSEALALVIAGSTNLATHYRHHPVSMRGSTPPGRPKCGTASAARTGSTNRCSVTL